MASQFGLSATSPVPFDSSNDFEAAFCVTPSKKSSSLPHLSPSKAFWTHPGLSKDWPQDGSDPDGNLRVNPLAREGSEGTIEREADIVIIGAGLTGVSVALELSKLAGKDGESMKAVLLEARDFCSGATGRNGGHLTSTSFQHFGSLAALHPLEEVKRCFGLEAHTVSSLLQMVKANSWEKDIDLIQGGHQVLLLSEAEGDLAKRDWEEAQKAGIDCANEVEWLSIEKTKKQYGASYPSFRTKGHNLWPLKLVTNLYQLAQGNHAPQSLHSKESSSDSLTPTCVEGVVNFVKSLLPAPGQPLNQVLEDKTQIPLSEKPTFPLDSFQLSLHTHTPVTSVTSVPADTAPMYDVHTPRGTIRTPLVVYATNAYTSHLLPHLAGPDGIIPVRGQVAAIRANVGYLDEGDAEGMTRTGWSGNKGFEYWFPRPHPSPSTSTGPVEKREHRRPLIIIGGGRETLREKGYGMYETNDAVLAPEASERLKKFLPTIFPGKFVTDGTVEVEWTGIMGFTKSGDPFVGRVLDADKKPVAGQYISAGYTGHGMPRAYGCAEALASLIWADKKQTHWSPPDWFPRHYLTQEFE